MMILLSKVYEGPLVSRKIRRRSGRDATASLEKVGHSCTSLGTKGILLNLYLKKSARCLC